MKSTYNAILFFSFSVDTISCTCNFIKIFSGLVDTMNWTGEHRAFTVETFIKTNESVTATQRAFHVHFKLGRHDPVPARNTILVWVNNFRATGSALKRKSTGRPRTARTPENVAVVRASVQQSPRRSILKRAQVLRLSERSLRRILHNDLQMHPYKMMFAQELSERDTETRRTCCLEIQQHVPHAAIGFFSDEAHFHLCGSVNKQNFRYWAESNPRELHERPLHCPRVTVWCAVAEFGIWGPYFFEENNVTVTVNSNRYCDMLETFLRPKLNMLHDMDNVWFQQDGATAHTSRRAMGILREMFPGHLISLRGDIGWPARSPDLNPCDFFLWGYLKSKVYSNRPQSIEELKHAIRQEIACIPHEMIRRVIDNFRERLRQCVDNNGSHLTDLIF